MTRSQLLAALIMVAVSTGAMAAPAFTAIYNASAATAQQAKAKKVEKKAAKPAPKKDDGKIKPLDPNRKVPTLKKKYKKD